MSIKENLNSYISDNYYGRHNRINHYLPKPGAAEDAVVGKVEPKVGAVVPIAGVAKFEDPNDANWVLVCPKLEPNPPNPIEAFDVGVVPNAVPKPVAVKAS